MSDYFYESMVAKMVSSNEYQQGYSVGFSSGYKQGKADAFKEILNEMEKSPFASDKATFAKKYIVEQLKEKKNEEI